MSEVPIACTLEGATFAERLVWIRQMFSRHLLDRREDGLNLDLVFAGEASDEVDELVRRERACCAFLDFRVQRSAGLVRLTIIAPEAARESAGLIFSAFDRAAPEEATLLSPSCQEAPPKGLLDAALQRLTGACSCGA